MAYKYFPGCTLHQQAHNFDVSARESARRLGLTLQDLDEWQCCGAVFPLATDAVINMAASYRALAAAHQSGCELVTLCSGCLNVLRRTNRLVSYDDEVQGKLKEFVEEDYSGEGEVYHLLEVMRRDVGWEKVASRVQRPLQGLNVGAFYGCLLLRPAEDMEFDDPESPTIMENCLSALGAHPIQYPFRTECCGAYVSLKEKGRAKKAVSDIVRSAAGAGSDLLVTSCPLCSYNLESLQADMADEDPQFNPLPVVYFTQLVGLALGMDEAECGFDENRIDPRKVLSDKSLIAEVR